MIDKTTISFVCVFARANGNVTLKAESVQVGPRPTLIFSLNSSSICNMFFE